MDVSSASPFLRPSSPALDVPPSLALYPGGCPPLDARSDRSASTPSTISSRSVSSSSARSESGRRKNGYMRPQGTAFSDSARNRDSVMSLGSIAHMQYYFARTGLLDGKGAQFAKPKKGVKQLDTNVAIYTTSEDGLVESPKDTNEEWSEPIMLPPTVSTYAYKEPNVPPPPDLPVLRQQLREALDDAQKVLQESAEGVTYDDATREAIVESVRAPTNPDEPPIAQGWHEIMGLHMLDIITLAIRAAKSYYTSHPRPQQLYAIQSERKIRGDLYEVLDVLKRAAAREFRGGIKEEERVGITSWIDTINDLMSKEQSHEQEEQNSRAKCAWRHGDWTGREREREWLFMSSFDTSSEPLPQWTESTPEKPSPFLQALQSGLRLVQLHNEMVRRSERPFGEIKTFFTDVAKPYRCAENLRFWSKASELRWETILSFNVLHVVHGKDAEAWKQFDETVFKWCRGVREEISKEWAMSEKSA
ncbi:hypothetical protein E4T50_01154 [Aureobasidium sp. EXF-12298]|nr:hypothetical protein E4T50_01154 [Aureobasidium sp. EXF-12298]KAI4766221.1 hypothetical protein E4T51_00811 [Aureobasidium sp. EXF-12344]KAI4783704.1 hypothetical protein E4T52_01345 [Aureobasidium sp. EXF-3400]